MIDIVIAELQKLLAEKGVPAQPILPDSSLLHGDLSIDSLDLATLVVALEERTGRDPFRAGFRMFTTVGELSALFTEAAA